MTYILLARRRYGSFNGLPDCMHKAYIMDLIRDKWKWSGFVVSDCDAIDNNHHSMSNTMNLTEAARRRPACWRGPRLRTVLPGPSPRGGPARPGERSRYR